MKSHRIVFAARICLLAFVVLACGACTALERGRDQTTQNNLLQAGFRKVPSENFEDSPAVPALPENTLSRIDKPEGTVYYFPLNDSIFLGGPVQAAAYQNLLVKARAKMASDAAERMVVRNRPIPAP